MSELNPSPVSTDTLSREAARDIAKLLLCLVVLAVGFAAYWVYPYPGGSRPSIGGFIALFFREALLFAFFGVAALAVVGLAAVRSIARLVSKLIHTTEAPK